MHSFGFCTKQCVNALFRGIMPLQERLLWCLKVMQSRALTDIVKSMLTICL